MPESLNGGAQRYLRLINQSFCRVKFPSEPLYFCIRAHVARWPLRVTGCPTTTTAIAHVGIDSRISTSAA